MLIGFWGVNSYSSRLRPELLLEVSSVPLVMAEGSLVT